MSANNGGPAFPFDEKEGNGDHYHSHPGMTLRDYFAAKAIRAIVADKGFCELAGFWASEAETAYAIADAMLAARDAS